jgi:DNA-binding transcriptional regulator WhiA
MWKLILAIPDLLKLVFAIWRWIKEIEQQRKEREIEQKIEKLKNAKGANEIKDITRDIVDSVK